MNAIVGRVIIAVALRLFRIIGILLTSLVARAVRIEIPCSPCLIVCIVIPTVAIHGRNARRKSCCTASKGVVTFVSILVKAAGVVVSDL